MPPVGPTMVNKEFEFIMNLVKADTSIQAADTSQSDCIYGTCIHTRTH